MPAMKNLMKIHCQIDWINFN